MSANLLWRPYDCPTPRCFFSAHTHNFLLSFDGTLFLVLAGLYLFANMKEWLNICRPSPTKPWGDRKLSIFMTFWKMLVVGRSVCPHYVFGLCRNAISMRIIILGHLWVSFWGVKLQTSYLFIWDIAACKEEELFVRTIASALQAAARLAPHRPPRVLYVPRWWPNIDDESDEWLLALCEQLFMSWETNEAFVWWMHTDLCTGTSSPPQNPFVHLKLHLTLNIFLIFSQHRSFRRMRTPRAKGGEYWILFPPTCCI